VVLGVASSGAALQSKLLFFLGIRSSINDSCVDGMSSAADVNISTYSIAVTINHHNNQSWHKHKHQRKKRNTTREGSISATPY
jgi:hypothetical protein